MQPAVNKPAVCLIACLLLIPISLHAATVQQNDASIAYSGSWFNISNSVFSGGSAVEAMDQGASATVTFTGTAVSWMGYKDAWSGIAQVYLDGALAATVDTYNANAVAQSSVWQASGLANTSHTVKVVSTYTRNSASSGYWVWVDAFNITTAAGNTITLTPDTLPDAVQNSNYSAGIQVASGGQPGYHFGYTGTIPPGLKIDLNNSCCSVVIHGIATSPGTYNFTLSVQDNYGNSGGHDYSITVTEVPLAVSPPTLPNGTQGIQYSQSIFASGGVPPYSFSIASGSLPTGVTASLSGSNNYFISGFPSAGGTYNFTVQVTDAASHTASHDYSVTIAPSGSASVFLWQSTAFDNQNAQSISLAFPEPNVQGDLIIAFVRMSTATQTVTVTDTNGNTYRDAVSQAQDADGHQIHVFYAKNIIAGSNTVTATFSAANQYPVLMIYEYAGLDTQNPLDATAHAQGNDNSPFTGTIATSAANELEFAATGLSSFYTGTVSPGPGYTMLFMDSGQARAASENFFTTAPGNQYAGRFNLSSSAAWTAVVATFKPVSSGGGLTLSPDSLPNATQGSGYDASVQASGGQPPYSFGLSSGSLPPGITYDVTNACCMDIHTNGEEMTPGTYNFTVSATDVNGLTGSKAYSITVNATALTIAPTSLPGGTVGQTYAALIQASGGSPPYAWSRTGNLPPGVTSSESNNAAIGLSGTPTTAGTYNFTVQVTDSHSGTVSRNYSIVIAPSSGGGGGGGTTTTIQQNDASITYGGTWFNINNGAFSGGSAVQAIDAGASATLTFTGAAVSWIGFKDQWSGIAQVYLDGTLAATVDEYSANQVSQTAVWQTSGLSNAAHTLKIVVTDTHSASASSSWVWIDGFRITGGDGTGGPTPPSFTTASPLTAGTVGTPYSASIQVSGGQLPFAYNITSGSLPPGLSRDVGDTGILNLHGTPTTAGTYNFTVQITDANSQTASKAYSITIAAASGGGGGTGTTSTIQQNDSAIAYTGSWFNINNGAFSGASAVEAMDQDASATLTFTGTGVSWIGYKDAWSGIAQVYLDGALVATVDTYSAAQSSQSSVWQISGLANTTHTLKIAATYTRNSASSGYWIWIDGFKITQ